jgi:hypothetical protein
LVERIVGEADEQQGWRARASAARAEETERLRLEMQQSKEARIEQSLREREAALQNPARQIPPTIGR